MKLLRLIRRALSLLPFDGQKLKIGVVIAALGQALPFLAGLDLLELARAIAENPTTTGVILALVGAADKLLKVKFPDIR